MENLMKKFDEIVNIIKRDTYYLTRNDIDSFEHKLRTLQNQLKVLYLKRGRNLNEHIK